MKISLTHEESENYFFNSICNALNYVESGYELELTYDESDYKKAKSKLENPCYEDVLMKILKDGGILTMKDIGCEDSYTSSININDVHQRVQNTNIRHLVNMINKNDDAVTGDVIIQQVFFNEIIFG